MIMKRLFLSIAMLTSAIFMMANDYKYLNVASNGASQDITLSTVQKITFTDTHVVVHTSNGEVTFPLTEMEKMSFTATPTAIDVLPLQTENLQFLQGQLVTNGKGILRIYNANGVLMQIARISQDKAVLNLDNLSSGMYIVNLGSQTIKISKQ